MTSSEVGRRFGDVLAEIRHEGRKIVITRNGRAVATLTPIESRGATLKEVAQIWRERQSPEDDAFADDLERVHSADQPAANPWES